MDPLTTAAAPRIAMNVLMVKTLKTSPLSDLLRSPKRPSAGEESMWEAEMSGFGAVCWLLGVCGGSNCQGVRELLVLVKGEAI